MNNDRIKFRVFDTLLKEYVDESETEILLHHNGELLFGNWWGNAKFAEHHFIIEQCTGLKDKNGDLIYEGDRVRAIVSDSRIIGETAGYSEYLKEITGIVKWNDRFAGFVIENANGAYTFFDEIADSEDIKIIGNIHKKE